MDYTARNQFSNASAISSADFMPAHSAATVSAEQGGAGETDANGLTREQRLLMERYANAGAISSADLAGDGEANEAGLARKMAGAGVNAAFSATSATFGGAKKLGGYAASWLSRGQTSPGASKDDL